MVGFVNCPNCKITVSWTNNERFKPFCSERCKLIDLGEWVTEKHTIPGQPTQSADDDESYL